MKTEPKRGQKVSWKSHGGEAHGRVVRKTTRPETIKSHRVAASPDNPQFIVATGEGKRAAHQAGPLKPD